MAADGVIDQRRHASRLCPTTEFNVNNKQEFSADAEIVRHASCFIITPSLKILSHLKCVATLLV